LRIVEAYVGEYASGKSECAVNRALQLHTGGSQVTLVDLDLVEPCYTLRPLKAELEKAGLTVLAWSTDETFGLGEAGQTLPRASRWVLRREGDIIIDLGYGTQGTSILNLLEEREKCREFRIIWVLNTARLLTSTPEGVLSYQRELGKVDAVLVNTHLAEETTPQDVLAGVSLAKLTGLPIEGVAVSEDFHKRFPAFIVQGTPLRILKRKMPQGFW